MLDAKSLINSFKQGGEEESEDSNFSFLVCYLLLSGLSINDIREIPLPTFVELQKNFEKIIKLKQGIN